MTASVLKPDPQKELLSDRTRFKKASSFELNSLIHVLLEGFSVCISRLGFSVVCGMMYFYGLLVCVHITLTTK